ncbi:MAG: 30S ribosomal protein S18 [Chloroherpetonaceae bacterium]|nr:30S ribosomal protein S18 [Chthonomonadaceae bacterium]MDW8206985.1 30S ribosomal protein S18 [Chloroherpetonaceae bacterium]
MTTASAPRKPAAKPGKFRRPRRKVCLFCAEKITEIDYKQMIQARFRAKLITERGKIVPRRTTGTCARHQRRVSEAIKRARHMALLPFVAE